MIFLATISVAGSVRSVRSSSRKAPYRLGLSVRYMTNAPRNEEERLLPDEPVSLDPNTEPAPVDR
jgi:hypothetical protein